MSNLAILHQFIAELARSKRVLLVGNDFELLQRLAMTELSELIICDSSADPNAPDGLTPLGSLLRFRADTKERPRSKDLIIDLSGLLNKAEVERLLKKSGQYICVKKRRFGGFTAQPIEVRSLQASLIGQTTASPPLSWSLAEKDPSNAPDDTWWMFTREAFELPNLVIAHDWGHQTNPKQAEQAERLRQDVETAELEIQRLKTQLVDAQRQQRETVAELKQSGTRNAELEKSNRSLQTKVDQLNLTTKELEKENDELSSAAARLKADENRFVRLEQRFEAFRTESQKEIEGLESELRALASPGQDRQALMKERDALKKQIGRIKKGFDDLFGKGLAGKKLPKIPPLEYDRSEAPFDLWLDRTALLLRTQQSELSTLKAAKKDLQGEMKRLEKQLLRAQAKTVNTKQIKPLSVNISAVTSSKREHHLQSLLESEIQRNAQLEKSFKLTLKRVSKVTDAYDALRDQLKMIEAAQNAERGHRLAAEADQRLLRQELMATHRELEERGTMLDTYASLQELLSNSLNQAEEARLDAEDARRLADENLKILQDEFERLTEQGLSK
ncbi:MAG: hypothetical protein ACPGQS_01960 [Bradymonadia bacterium]